MTTSTRSHVVEAARQRAHARHPVTPRALLSHTSGLGDGFGFPGYHPSAPRPTVVEILNGSKPSNVGPVFDGAGAVHRLQVLRRRLTVCSSLMTDTFLKPYPEIVQSLVLGPIGMSDSAYDQPLSSERDRHAARAQQRRWRAMDAKWHVYPELAASRPVDDTDRPREVRDRDPEDGARRSSKVLTQASVREMLTPVGVGDYAVGLGLSKLGQGWYFGHGGSNWGFQCDFIAHRLKGTGWRS